MIFLEYVCRQLMGPPAYGRTWRCPFHDDHNPSFNVRPPKAGYKDRYRCWGCDAWGDEADIVKHFFPNESYTERLERLKDLRAEFEAGGHAEPPPSSRGVGSIEVLCPECLSSMSAEDIELETFSARMNRLGRDLICAYGEPTSPEEFRRAWKFAQLVLETCVKEGIHPAVMASKIGFLEWTHGRELEHAETCGDCHCDWSYCVERRKVS
jgi:hypothetical protein